MGLGDVTTKFTTGVELFHRLLVGNHQLVILWFAWQKVNTITDLGYNFYRIHGDVPELADGPDLGSGAERRVGSNPTVPI